MTPEALRTHNDQQARTIKALWLRVTRQDKRITTQAGMIVWLQARVAELEAELTPQAQAERHFKDGKA